MEPKARIQSQECLGKGIRFSLQQDHKEIARAFLYILTNDLHKEPFGLLEDVFVQEPFRRQGNGERIVRAVIEEARKQGCYKLIFTSRHAKNEVHAFYNGFGFKNHGIEFRLDL